QLFHTVPRALPPESGRISRYGMALLSCGVTFIVCLFLNEALSGSLPLTLFIVPVVVSAWFGGLGPGLLATGISALASDYFLTETRFEFFAMDTADWERLILFLATSVMVNWVIVIMRDARREVETRAHEALQRQIELEEQIIERERARAERERLIAEEKRASEALRINEERLKLAQQASRSGSFEWNLQTNSLIWSEENEILFGLKPGSFSGEYMDWTKCMHSEDVSRAKEELRRAVENGEGLFEYRVIRPDGGVRWIQSRGKLFTGETGEPSRLIGINIDITERKQMEESLRRQTRALQEADRRKDEFLAILAHELRNPLAPISNAIHILELRGDDPKVVAQTRVVMERQVHQMARVVDDLLEVSRIGRGKIGLEKAPVDLADVVATAVETCRPLVEAHHHTLTVSLPERPVRVEADSARLAQVLSNLLNNAAKYTGDGGRIDLIVEQSQGDAVIRVRDNGIGIASERLPTVFDMFEQVEGAADRSQGGLGIGLTLSRRLVEMHGGKIEAHSAGLGKGSEFVTRLPAIAEPATETASKLEEKVYAPPSGGPMRVLVVDDNVDSAESMAMLLRLYGHEVRLAHDGEAALEEARSFKPDVMFLDLSLPKMDGYEVARRLRQEPATSGMTLVAMTGYGHEEERRRTHEAGFHSHLVKPVDFDLLRELLSSLSPNQTGEPARNERGRGKAN
ncbi:MAG TPA: ATP-binding protein, partial [Blastocatellia bacterium]|nr:ATP-binding protein [Blastocatellia bacterium]